MILDSETSGMFGEPTVFALSSPSAYNTLVSRIHP